MKAKLIALLLPLILIFIPYKAKAQYYEKLILNFPEEMKYQPLDIKIKFKNDCHAINEEKHSIRVLYKGKEIDSQIYNLKFENNLLKECNIVFLYHGKGEYLIEYGEDVKKKDYKDFVSIEDSFYYVEPIPGYFAKLNYYSIKENGRIVFGICQEGNVLGIEMANKVIKLKDNSTEFKMQNWEQMFSFALFQSDSGTDEKMVSKKIIVDGNLMVRVVIQSISKNKKMRTHAIYTYYYSPTKEKRLFVKLYHEAEKSEENTTYAYLMCVKSRSKTIEELNMGEILPYIHLNGRNGIEEYRMDTNPENKENKWLISSKDNVVLGERGWVCIDNKNKAYALIFSKSGLQVRAAVREEVNIPGLEIDGGGVSVGGNNRIFEGEIEFFYGSYAKVSKEANAFFDFYDYRNFYYEGKEEKEEKEERKEYNLSVFVNKFSIPFSSHLSAFFGINIPHLEAEIWKDKMIAKTIINFRKAKFRLPEGEYIVKIYYNGIFSRKFIGFKYVVLDEDKKIRISCTFEGEIKIKVKNGTKIRIFHSNALIEENISNGEAIIKVPCFKEYELKLIYKGILVHEEKIFLFFKVDKEYKFNTYDLKVDVVDKLGLPIGINITPILFGKDAVEDYKMYGFHFKDLPKGIYKLIISYKGYKIEREIEVYDDKFIKILFPAEYNIEIKTYDSRGFPIKAKCLFERNGMEFEKNILPPAEYLVKIYDKQLIATKKIFVLENERYEIVTKKFSPYPYLLPIAVLSSHFIIMNLRNKGNNNKGKKKWIKKTIIITLLSTSLVFSWWHTTEYYNNEKSQVNLYMLPPTMIQFHSSYGNIVSLPSMFRFALYISLLFLIFSIILTINQKLFKFSFLPLLLSLITYVISLKKFTSITGGGMNFGIGFYLALTSLFLIIIKVIINEARRSS